MEPTTEPAPVVLPEPPVQSRHARVARPQRPGQLSHRWSTAFWIAWAGVAGGFAAIWYSSRVTGFSTWWLGPETAPRFILISILPFLAPIALAIAGFVGVRRLPWWGIAGALVTAFVAWGDVGRVNGYAATEFALALGGLLVSVAAFAGVLRAPEPDSEPDSEPDAVKVDDTAS
jgi:hypothetical protein